MMGTVRVSQRMTVLKVEAAPNTLFLTVPKLLCRRLPVVVLQDGTVGTVMVAVLIQILDYSALNMVSYFAARKGIFLMYTTRITSVIRFCSGHKEARTRRALKIVGLFGLRPPTTLNSDRDTPGKA